MRDYVVFQTTIRIAGYLLYGSIEEEASVKGSHRYLFDVYRPFTWIVHSWKYFY